MTEQNRINVREVVKMMLLRRNVTMSALADALNKRYGYSLTQSNLSRKLINETVRWREFQDISELLGYKVRLEENKQWTGFALN